MIRLREIIGRLRGSMNRVLPDGCPFVIGGGLVRDAIYGGRPNDIDIWLPSNIHIPDVDAFCAHLVNSGYGPRQGFQGQVIFRGPGSRVEEVIEGVLGDFGDAEHDLGGYGDVHNHWVIELQPMDAPPDGSEASFGYPRVNIMRNMARWTGDAPSFFTEIMRNFDLDLCMFFVGYMPGQTQVNTVIMPQHLRDGILHPQNNGVVRTRMNEIYWNQARLETTSRERILSRVRKMNEKYSIHLPEDVSRISMIPTADIVAVPVLLSELIQRFNRVGGFGNMAIPTRFNRVYQHQLEEAIANAQTRYQEYRANLALRGMPVPPGLTPMTFISTHSY